MRVRSRCVKLEASIDQSRWVWRIVADPEAVPRIRQLLREAIVLFGGQKRMEFVLLYGFPWRRRPIWDMAREATVP